VQRGRDRENVCERVRDGDRTVLCEIFWEMLKQAKVVAYTCHMQISSVEILWVKSVLL
jgi:hypothetical protein